MDSFPVSHEMCFPLMAHVPLSWDFTALYQHLPDRSVGGLKKLMRCEWHFGETLGGRMARFATAHSVPSDAVSGSLLLATCARATRTCTPAFSSYPFE